MTTHEEPHVTEAMQELLARWGTEAWFFDARQVNDNCGARLEILVHDDLYLEDVLPRKLKDCYVVVRKVKTEHLRHEIRSTIKASA